jgi:hypothetical protein
MSFYNDIRRSSETVKVLGDHVEFLLDLEEEEARFGPCELPRRILRDRDNPLESLRPLEFRIIFGMSKDSFRRVLGLIEVQLVGPRQHNPVSLNPIHKLTIFLQFLRTNGFQKSVGSQHHIRVSQSVVCEVVNNVAKIIAGLVPQFVTFPDVQESAHIGNELFQLSGLPGVCGVIDGTHVQIVKPQTQDPPPERYYNRKKYYSVNCIATCDHLVCVCNN